MKILLIITLISHSCYAQSKGDNIIKVQNVGFAQVCNSLLDAGYIIEKKDNELQTIKTEFKNATGKIKQVKISMNIRMKDSVAMITGQFYNEGVIGTKFLGQEQTVENSTDNVKYTSGFYKECFNQMNLFAKSLGKQISYSKH